MPLLFSVLLSACSTYFRPVRACPDSSGSILAQSGCPTGCAFWPTWYHSIQQCSLSWQSQSMSDCYVWLVAEKHSWFHLWKPECCTWKYRQEGSCIESKCVIINGQGTRLPGQMMVHAANSMTWVHFTVYLMWLKMMYQFCFCAENLKLWNATSQNTTSNSVHWKTSDCQTWSIKSYTEQQVHKVNKCLSNIVFEYKAC